MANKILVIGSSNTDMVVSTPRLPVPGETVIGGSLVMSPGGKGANQAVAAARLGGEVVLVARVGRDIFGQEALRHYQREGIDTDHVITDAEAPSGVALIMVGRDGQNMISVASGANSRLTAADVRAASGVFAEAKVVLLQLEVPLSAVVEAVTMARAAGALVILNPAPAQPLPPELLAQVDILTPNEIEAVTLSGALTPHVRASTLLMKGVETVIQQGVETVIVTLGEVGVLLAKSGVAPKSLPAFPVDAVDTTAAGDAFNGGLAVALARGESLEVAVEFAQAVAALSVTKRGAQLSLPTGEEVERFLQQRGRA